uniref:Uncharacterized protein n=1 Tax=Avena sativa TaxID=4498 RepID=A0ACD6A3D0_AVESA
MQIQTIGTLSGFMPKMMAARQELCNLFLEGSVEHEKYSTVVDKRIENLCKNTLMAAATVLDPRGHYKFNFAKKLTYVNSLSSALKKMASESEYIKLIPQMAKYINCRGSFDSSSSREAALSLSPTDWWLTFGGETELLQKYALRIVSQCVSSSGCERNWSTFALIHTIVRNRLSFEKIHKMVFCHYNLRMRIRQILDEAIDKEVDTCVMLMDASLFDSESPIMDWLTHSMSESEPAMDEYDGFNQYTPAPAIVEVVQKRVKRKRSIADLDDEDADVDEDEDEDEDEYEEEEEVVEEVDDDSHTEGKDDDCAELPLHALRKSTRKKKKSLKVLASMCDKQA